MSYDPAYPPAAPLAIDDEQMREQFAELGAHLMQHLIAAGWSGKDGFVVFVRPGSPPAIDAPTSADELSFNGAVVTDFVARGGRYAAKLDYEVSGGALALSANDGMFLGSVLDEAVSANGITVSGLVVGQAWSGIVRLRQDGTGGRQIGGSTNVNPGFNATTFDLLGQTIAMPQTAGKGVLLGLTYPGEGKVYVLNLGAEQ